MKFVRTRAFRLIVVSISLLLVAILSRSIYSLWKKKDIVGERLEALRKVEAENQRLRKALEEAQSPEFIERQAREKLGLAKEGEEIVLLPKSNPPTSGSVTNEEKEGEKDEPRWKQWWRLFF